MSKVNAKWCSALKSDSVKHCKITRFFCLAVLLSGFHWFISKEKLFFLAVALQIQPRVSKINLCPSVQQIICRCSSLQFIKVHTVLRQSFGKGVSDNRPLDYAESHGESFLSLSSGYLFLLSTAGWNIHVYHLS